MTAESMNTYIYLGINISNENAELEFNINIYRSC